MLVLDFLTGGPIAPLSDICRLRNLIRTSQDVDEPALLSACVRVISPFQSGTSS